MAVTVPTELFSSFCFLNFFLRIPFILCSHISRVLATKKNWKCLSPSHDLSESCDLANMRFGPKFGCMYNGIVIPLPTF